MSPVWFNQILLLVACNWISDSSQEISELEFGCPFFCLSVTFLIPSHRTQRGYLVVREVGCLWQVLSFTPEKIALSRLDNLNICFSQRRVFLRRFGDFEGTEQALSFCPWSLSQRWRISVLLSTTLSSNWGKRLLWAILLMAWYWLQLSVQLRTYSYNWGVVQKDVPMGEGTWVCSLSRTVLFERDALPWCSNESCGKVFLGDIIIWVLWSQNTHKYLCSRMFRRQTVLAQKKYLTRFSSVLSLCSCVIHICWSLFVFRCFWFVSLSLSLSLVLFGLWWVTTSFLVLNFEWDKWCAPCITRRCWIILRWPISWWSHCLTACTSVFFLRSRSQKRSKEWQILWQRHATKSSFLSAWWQPVRLLWRRWGSVWWISRLNFLCWRYCTVIYIPL